MSVQLAKSSSSTTPTPERRTPLSLGSSGGKSSKPQSSDSEKDLLNTGKSLNTSSGNISKTVSKNDKTENSATDLKKANNDKIDKKNVSSDNLNSAKEKINDDKKKDDKKKDKDKESFKKDDKKQENGMNDKKDIFKSNGHKDEGKKIVEVGEEEANNKTSGTKEILKQKEIKEQKFEQKEGNKEEKPLENKKIIDKKININIKNDESEKKSTKKKIEDLCETSKKETDKELDVKKKLIKESEIGKKDEKKLKEINLTSQKNDEVLKANPPTPNNSISSLLMEKDLKGFTIEGEEMESLIFEPESDTNVGPIETSTPGKILKIKKKPPPSSVQVSVHDEHHELYDKSDSVNMNDDKLDVEITESTPLERPQLTSYRAISGRRSLRPMREYSFQTSYRESYRKINTELDCTSSSMNVTVGSEIPNDSFFSLFGRGKKRDRTPPVSSSNDSNNEDQLDIELSPKSPKRAKLDFSGIIGFVASPVTLLRSKLSRTKIQSSTPNGKVTSTTKEDEEDGVENVSVIASEGIAANDIGDISDDANMKDVELIKKDINDEFKICDGVEVAEIVDDFQTTEQINSSLDNFNKRRMCNVM